MKPRVPVRKISAKKLAANGNRMPFSTIKPSLSKKGARKTAMPWNMCRTCHRAGTPSKRSILKCPTHLVMPVGECGQCGKRRPLVNCHAYDFRAYAFRRGARKKPRKSIRKVNPVAKAKRTARYRKMLAGKEYKAARAEAFKRAEDRCEHVDLVTFTWSGGPLKGRSYDQRCFEMLNLHAHHLRYPKSRPLAASDLTILCPYHHWEIESQKLGKMRMF